MLNESPKETQQKYIIHYVFFILISFTLSGILQEYVYTHEYKWGFFQTLIMNVIFTILSSIRLGRKKIKKYYYRTTRNVTFLKWYFAAAFLSVVSLGVGNQSLLYINYPTKTMFKSCKMLVTMIFGVLILKRKYIALEYIASILLLIGLFFLYVANQVVKLEYTLFGLALIASALFCDSISSNLQEYLLQDSNETPGGYLFVVNFFGSVLMILFCLLTNQVGAVMFLLKHPLIALSLVLSSICHYSGSYYLHATTKRYGILTSLTTTTARKAFTIILSYILFPKPFTLFHLYSVILIFAGIIIYSFAKIKKKTKHQHYSTLLSAQTPEFPNLVSESPATPTFTSSIENWSSKKQPSSKREIAAHPEENNHVQHKLVNQIVEYPINEPKTEYSTQYNLYPQAASSSITSGSI